MSQPTVEQALQAAQRHHQAGQLPQAEALYRQILQQDANHPEALHLLGVIAHQVGRHDDAVELIGRAVALKPNYAEACGNLGVALRALGRLDAAIAAYRRAIALNPGIPEAHHNLGTALADQGRFAEAVAAHRQAIALKPDYAEAYGNLAVALKSGGQLDAAIAALRQAIALQPHSPDAHSNLGNALRGKGQLDAAIAAYRQALALKPNYPEACSNLGVALKDQGDLDAAVAAHRRAIALNPNYAEAYSNLGSALQAQGQLDAAVAALRQAIALNPRLPEAHNNLGNALQAQGQLDAAVAALRQAIALKPRYAEAFNNLGVILCDTGRFDESITAHRQALALAPDEAWIHSNLVLALHYHPAGDAQTIAAEQRNWNLQHAAPLKRYFQPHTNDRAPERRLRIGYVSPDFRDHVVGRNVMPLFKHMDCGQFEAFCYADVAVSDPLTEEFRRRAGTFRVVSGMSHTALAERIRADGIDILVDLALHTAGNRLPVFARRPAPVQVTFAGYPGSTGLDAIGYRLTDPYLDPLEPGVDERYVEKSMRLPATFWCYDPLEACPPAVGPLPALGKGQVTFGCLNNFCKVNDGVLKLWARVLAGVAGSRLVLLAEEGSHRERTLEALEGLGVSRARVRFEAKRPRGAYLKLYQQIDIGLDTVPYNGHTTSLDSYFMGVPVVTLVGRTVVGRAGFSQLMNLGLPELIGRTEEQYVQIARGWAGDLGRLAGLRAGLRGRMEASPLMDGQAFACGIEAAYRQMWRRWCATAAKS